LGFLANIAKEDVRDAVQRLVRHDFEKEPRSVLRLESERDLFDGMNFALNEVTVSRKDTTDMITIHVYLKDQLLNTYWADGLIISTPLFLCELVLIYEVLKLHYIACFCKTLE